MRGPREGVAAGGLCLWLVCRRMGVGPAEEGASGVWLWRGRGCEAGDECGVAWLRPAQGWWVGCGLWGFVLMWGVELWDVAVMGVMVLEW